jgi:hypothetical protein
MGIQLVEGREVELVVAWKGLLWLLILAGWTCFFWLSSTYIDVNMSRKFQGVLLFASNPGVGSCVGMSHGLFLPITSLEA